MCVRADSGLYGESKEAIEESLSAFNGTILMVSHDRYLLDIFATGIVEIRDTQFRKFYGNFSEYWVSPLRVSEELNERPATRSRQYRGTQKRRDNRNADRQRQGNGTSRIESRLTELESDKVMLEEELARAFEAGDHEKGRKLSAKHAGLIRRIERLYEEWETV